MLFESNALPSAPVPSFACANLVAPLGKTPLYNPSTLILCVIVRVDSDKFENPTPKADNFDNGNLMYC